LILPLIGADVEVNEPSVPKNLDFNPDNEPKTEPISYFEKFMKAQKIKTTDQNNHLPIK